MPEPYDANQENEETTGANTPPLAKLRGGRGRKASTARAPLIVVADRGTLKAYKVRQTNHGLSSRVMTEKNLAGLITSSRCPRIGQPRIPVPDRCGKEFDIRVGNPWLAPQGIGT